MLKERGKINTEQAFAAAILMTLPPALRFLPKLTSAEAGRAAWLTPLFAALPLAALVLVLHEIFKNQPNMSLSGLMRRTLGNIAAKIILLLFLCLNLLLASTNLRYYAELCQSTTMPDASMPFLLFLMAAAIFIMARSGIVSLARLCHALLWFFGAAFSVLFLLAIFNIQPQNIFPIAYTDLPAAIIASRGELGVWGYLPLIMLAGDKLSDVGALRREGLKSTLAVCLFALLLHILVLGTLGAHTLERFTFPFFIMVKNINLMGMRINSLILALWTIADSVAIAILVVLCTAIIREVFGLKKPKLAVAPLCLIILLGAAYLVTNQVALERLSLMLFPALIGLSYGIPLLLLIVGKLRGLSAKEQ